MKPPNFKGNFGAYALMGAGAAGLGFLMLRGSQMQRQASYAAPMH